MKKDKVKVLDEVLTEDRIKQFLSLEPPEGENVDFHRLQKAYRGMPVQYFETFVEYFVNAGGDINARSRKGDTFLQSINDHKQSSEYRNILIKANAK